MDLLCSPSEVFILIHNKMAVEPKDELPVNIHLILYWSAMICARRLTDPISICSPWNWALKDAPRSWRTPGPKHDPLGHSKRLVKVPYTSNHKHTNW